MQRRQIDMRNPLAFGCAVACAALVAGGIGTARAAEPVTLKLAFPPPPVSFFNGKVLAPWGKEIEAATKGAVKVQIFVGPSLASFGNMYDRILNGVADLGWGLHGPFGTQFRKTAVTTLPGIATTAMQCSKALWALYASGVIADEYEEVKPISLGCFVGSGFISTTPIRSVDDVKGLKVYVGSKSQGEIVERLGGAPITGNTSDIYQGLQRGTFEAATTGWAAVAAFRLHEVAKYGFDAPIGSPTNFLFMNKSSFAKLPADARRAIERHSGPGLSEKMGQIAHDENTHGREMVEKMPDHVITTMSEAGIARLRKTMQPMIDQWVKATPDGAKVLAAYKAELAKAGGGK